MELKQDLVAELKNDAAGIGVRRDNFKALRKQFEALIKFRRGEDPHAFELRKLALNQQLDEAERFLVESENMQIRWTTDTVKGLGRGELSLTALPETELLTSVPSVVDSVAAMVCGVNDKVLAGTPTSAMLPSESSA